MASFIGLNLLISFLIVGQDSEAAHGIKVKRKKGNTLGI